MTTPGNAGRFDGYDVLSQANHWDAVTQGVVLRRLGPPAPLRFFTEAEGAVARGLLDRLLGQDDGPRIDVLADIDSRLALEVTDGWHYADLPHDGEAWRQTLAWVDDDAHERFGSGFARLEREQQAAVLQAVQERIGGRWHDYPARQVWSLWTRYACATFYAHPWAWNEIGFGGPAYPRGYKNIGLDKREPWEKPERDAKNPVPWVHRTEAARRKHLDGLRAIWRPSTGCCSRFRGGYGGRQPGGDRHRKTGYRWRPRTVGFRPFGSPRRFAVVGISRFSSGNASPCAGTG